jgi:hypothetical protein
MWGHMVLVRTDVSEERIASIIRVERISELGTLMLTFIGSWFFHPWFWRRYVPPKRPLLQEPHSVTSQKAAFLIVTAVKTWNLINFRLFADLLSFLPLLNYFHLQLSSSLYQSLSYVQADGEKGSPSWCQTPVWAHDQIVIAVRQLRVCWCGIHFLKRVRVCCLQLLLGRTSAFILGSESRGTQNHILLLPIQVSSNMMG